MSDPIKVGGSYTCNRCGEWQDGADYHDCAVSDEQVAPERIWVNLVTHKWAEITSSPNEAGSWTIYELPAALAKQGSPPADTVERARELIDSCAVDGDVAPSGRLYVTVAHDTLARRISAALVEKERDVWDKAIATAKETAKRLGQGDDYIAAQQVNGVLRTIDALIAVRTSKKGTHEPTS